MLASNDDYRYNTNQIDGRAMKPTHIHTKHAPKERKKPVVAKLIILATG